jgi:hypothetical protein
MDMTTKSVFVLSWDSPSQKLMKQLFYNVSLFIVIAHLQASTMVQTDLSAFGTGTRSF